MMLTFSVLEYAASVDFALLGPMPVDNCLLQFMVAVPAEHVTLTIDRESALHVSHQFRCEKFRRNREPLALAPHVGTASLRLHNDLRLQEVERGFQCPWCT